MLDFNIEFYPGNILEIIEMLQTMAGVSEQVHYEQKDEDRHSDFDYIY